MPAHPQLLSFWCLKWGALSVPRKNFWDPETAASIIAKVTRDEFMNQQHVLYPDYGFDSNKGYLTKKHIQAINTHGPCPIHRYSFEPINSITTLKLFD